MTYLLRTITALLAAVGLAIGALAAAAPAHADDHVTLTVTELPGQVRLMPGEKIEVTLQTNRTAGYQWSASTTGKKKAIKVSKGVRLPGIEYANRALGKPQSGKTVFLHGGYWKADPVYPGGLKNSSLFGRSSNQEMLVAPKNASIKVDDFVFLRPTQSEAVFLQFPKIAVFSGGQIQDLWAPLPVTA